jgi:hypothetical protein
MQNTILLNKISETQAKYRLKKITKFNVQLKPDEWLYAAGFVHPETLVYYLSKHINKEYTLGQIWQTNPKNHKPVLLDEFTILEKI